MSKKEIEICEFEMDFGQYKTQTADCGLGIKPGLGINCGLRTEYKTRTRHKTRTTEYIYIYINSFRKVKLRVKESIKQ